MVKVDRATMWNSIEGREPLLDHRIIEKSFSIASDLKLAKKVPKYILRSIVWDLVPKKMIDRPKQGFVMPLDEWLRGPLKGLLDELVNRKH